ncbi:hypothetical protein CcaverHIS631_0402730 [Cutaneotrichosporon cavernicola]|nr:hypothetical protein CcaverHIS631_0402730 [Cutaneotrichosporon cavernicola]
MDIAAFPHILESILSYAPPASLVILRGVSRDLHNRADARLFAHIQFAFPNSEAGYISIRAARAPVTLKWLRYGTGAKARDNRRARTRRHVAHLVSEARVLDGLLEGFVGAPPAAQQALLAAAPGICLSPDATVRVLHGFDRDWRAYECLVRLCDGLYLDHRPVISLADTPFLPLTPSRLAYTVLVARGVPPPSDVLRRHIRESNRVLHLLLDTPRPSQGVEDHLLAQLFEPALFCTARQTESTRTLTVVGGGAELRALLGLPASTGADEFETAVDVFADSVWYVAPDGGARDDSHHGTAEVMAALRRKHLHFLTPEEYVMQVGAEQVALETQIDPMGEGAIINLGLEVGPITGYPLYFSPLEVVVIHLVHSDDTLAPVDTLPPPILHQILSIPFTWETNGVHLAPQVTVVGGAQECRISLGLHPAASDDEFFTALDRTAASPDAIEPHWREYVRFISPKEHAAEVGAAQVVNRRYRVASMTLDTA